MGLMQFLVKHYRAQRDTQEFCFLKKMVFSCKSLNITQALKAINSYVRLIVTVVEMQNNFIKYVYMIFFP